MHYSDPTSREYRDRFLHAPLFAGLSLTGMRALDAMSGSGSLSDYLQRSGARVTGLDISPTQIAMYQKKLPGCQAVCGSMLESGLPDASFDLVAVVGGLHHLHPNVLTAIDEVHRLLRPGGYFCFTEPHTGSLPDVLRQLWYRFDPLFEENEAAIDVGLLKRANQQRFTFEIENYVGNVAYIVVLNSMVLRLPVGLKKYYAGPAMRLESLLNRILPRLLACYTLCRWRKL
ncbi:class I SAM-dependent methyltransferase [bacterium CPR1]|nr:class I SAM-dependent methyltransferase [bacterium CPR1]